MRLQEGSRVCIVGGGPAGSFAAMHLLAMAQASNLHLDVMIFEPRDFSRPGRGSCKGCAGILSAGLVREMKAFGLELPPDVVQSELNAYVVHINEQVTCIEQPDPARQILSVYRGTGPHRHTGQPLSSFDAYLLAQARARGARLIPSKVRLVEWDGRPVVQTSQASFPADLLVLATGVNSHSPLAPRFGYQSPQTVPMAQMEVPRPENWPEGKVAGFMGGLPQLVFGAIVPKRQYLNVSLLWKGDAKGAMRTFYQANQRVLEHFFPAMPQDLCNCTPCIVVRPAKNHFGQRWVAVGDAAVSRLYKDGIHSAFLTARAAMQTAIEHGVDERDFGRFYAPFCRAMAADNIYGELMFGLGSLAMRQSFVARAYANCIRAESDLDFGQWVCSRLVWGMLTGDESYRDLFFLALRPGGLLALARGFSAAILNAEAQRGKDTKY